MWKMYNETKTELSIHLSGEDEIDILELSDFLSDTYEVFKDVASYYGKDYYFKMNFSKAEKGSIKVFLSAIAPLLPNIFENGVTALTTIKTAFEVIKIIKDLKGEKPKKIDFEKNSIENNYGEVNFYSANSINIYYTKPVEKKVKKSFADISEREGIKYELIEEGISVEMRQNEIKEIVNKLEVEETEETDILYENIEINLFKVPFQGNSKWDIIYNDKKIKVSVWDKEFLKKLHAGEIFLSAQDIFIVDMREIKEKNKTKYYILKVQEVKRLENIKIY